MTENENNEGATIAETESHTTEGSTNTGITERFAIQMTEEVEGQAVTLGSGNYGAIDTQSTTA